MRQFREFFKAKSDQRIFPVIVACLALAFLLWHLHRLWNPNGEYAYGWAVPLIVLFLLKSRWDDRPPPSLPSARGTFFAISCALMLLPTLWLQVAAPERGICNWSYAVAAVGLSLSLIALAGGLGWMRWFFFPIAFALTAVPWPHNQELFVTTLLMRLVAKTTVEIICFFGIPAIPSGNLIHLSKGVLDIDEACSGIRSLQAMVMISLFLGELFRLRFGRRLFLVALGVIIALLGNTARTVALAVISSAKGMDAVDQYHDIAGFSALALSLLGALVAAYLLHRRNSAVPMPSLGLLEDVPRMPRRVFQISIAILVWLCFIEISVEAWYRIREPKWDGWSWAVQWPREKADFHKVSIPERSVDLLQCDTADAAAWKEGDGADWTAYWIRWSPYNASAQTAKVHRPDICLNAAGATMLQDLGVHISKVGSVRLPVRQYAFLIQGRIVYVFFSLYEEGGKKDPKEMLADFGTEGLLHRAYNGRRHIGQQTLEVALAGYDSPISAQEAFEAHLPELLKIRNPLNED